MKVQITAIEYDFECDDGPIPESYQNEVTNETIGKVYCIDVDPEYPDEDRLMYLADMITDETGWCIKTLEYVVV